MGFLIYKKQLLGFDNSPNSQVISIDYPFSKSRIGLGLNGFKDQNGATGFSGFESTFAYHISSEKNPLTGFSFDLTRSTFHCFKSG